MPEEHPVEPTGTVDGNSLIRAVSSREVPFMHNQSDGTVRVSRREFIGDILSPGNYTSYQYRITICPGDAPGGSFLMAPWLSGIAKHWQKYSFLGVAFEYIPTSSILSTAASPALGSVSMGIQYDQQTSSAAYTKLDVLNLDNSVSASPASSIIIPVECKGDETVLPVKFIRESGTTPAGDGRFFDLGLLIMHLEGFNPSNQFTCGELWVTYDVVLMGTKLPVSPGSRLVSSYLPAPLQVSYETVFPPRLGFHISGRSSEELLERDCEVASAVATLHAPSARVAWERARFAATTHNHGLLPASGRSKKTEDTSPPGGRGVVC